MVKIGDEVPFVSAWLKKQVYRVTIVRETATQWVGEIAGAKGREVRFRKSDLYQTPAYKPDPRKLGAEEPAGG